MRQPFLLVLAALFAVALPVVVISGQIPRQAHPVEEAVHPSERWRPAIEAFAEMDAQSPPDAGGILFLGSSSIRLWDLDEWFSDLPTLNRGFGGPFLEAGSVEIFDSQDDLPAALPGEGPIHQKRAGVAQVQGSGGRGG